MSNINAAADRNLRTLGVLCDPGIDIPAGTRFADLKLHRLPTGVVSLDYEVLMKVWVASGMPSELLYTSRAPEILSFVARWYAEHMRGGGASDRMHVELVAYLMGKKSSLLRIVPMPGQPTPAAQLRLV